jgi:hypothetical protein
VKETSHLDLLADLTKLLKKHGPETFRALAEALRDPEQLASLSDTLEVLSKESIHFGVTKQGRTSPGSALRAQLDEVANTSPEKANLLRQLWERLMASESVTSSELRSYARRAGLPQLKSGERGRVVQAFVASLITLDIAQIQHHIDQIPKGSGDNENDLAGWSRIILDPKLRSAQGA